VKGGKGLSKTREFKGAADTWCGCMTGQCHVRDLPFWKSKPGKL